jgi:hypothetical protein
VCVKVSPGLHRDMAPPSQAEEAGTYAHKKIRPSPVRCVFVCSSMFVEENRKKLRWKIIK